MFSEHSLDGIVNHAFDPDETEHTPYTTIALSGNVPTITNDQSEHTPYALVNQSGNTSHTTVDQSGHSPYATIDHQANEKVIPKSVKPRGK